MEEVFSRRKIVEPAELKALNERSDLIGLLQMGSHLGLVGLLGVAHYMVMGTWWVLLTGFCLGVVLNFLYAAQHELSHWTVFRTRWLNEVFGRFIGFFMLFPRDYDLIMHYSHHRFTQDWDKDGELVREPYTLKTFLLWMSGLTYWRNRFSVFSAAPPGPSSSPISTRTRKPRLCVKAACICWAMLSLPPDPSGWKARGALVLDFAPAADKACASVAEHD